MSFSLCVFCGAALGNGPEYAAAARAVGAEIGRRGWTLVYGGGHVGLMGVLADSALAAGARVVGVIPKFLYDREVAHRGLTQLEIVASFAERKQRMGELSDAFLSLPGGVGTMDELFEAWSWTQARLQDKPSGLLNVAGYYDELIGYVERAVAVGFIKPESRGALRVSGSVPELFDALTVPVPRS
ncbi:MAG TPA: TIGR00730 family Rossman fold protein [Steroidobacteraceae bacterium]